MQTFSPEKKSSLFTACIFVAMCFIGSVVAQPVVLQNYDSDSLLPAFNKLNESYSISDNYVTVSHSNVYKIIKKDGNYFTMGAFSHLATNHGSAVIVDTATNTVITPQKWNINGVVKTVLPDGMGGYFIGGLFTKIGDSTRRYLAQIDASGKPTQWRPVVDSFVKVMLRRNDTLFIGGSFRKFAGAIRYCFAMYSLNGDSLINNGGTAGFSYVKTINDMLIVKDTLVFGGTSADEDISPIIKKYNFRNKYIVSFDLQFTQYGEVSSLQLSPDATTLLYSCYDNGDYVRGVNYANGNFKYIVKVYNPILGAYDRRINKIKTVGNITYVVGPFNGLISSDGNIFVRKGFAAFDTYSGQVFNVNLQADGFIYFIEKLDGKIVVSGKFNSIAGQPRTNMAMLDTGTLNLNTWSLSPTDQLTAMCMQNNKTFVAGEFKGLFAVKRNGFAAINASTNIVTDWNPTQHSFLAGKRMFLRGDSLFVLGITGYSNGNYIASLRLYSTTTGAEYTLPDMGYSMIHDCVIDSDYLYVSADKKLRRYRLPNFIPDLSWGTNWNNFNPLLNVHNPIHIIVDSAKIYTVGDTRYQDIGGTFEPQRGYVARYNKTTGQAEFVSFYEDSLPLYEPVTFESATLSGNKIYIAGYFKKLNSQTRKNFVCVDASNGNILPLQTNFSNNDIRLSRFNNASNLTVRDGKLWFAAPSSLMANGSIFGGFGAIDTTNSALQTPSLVALKITPEVSGLSVGTFTLSETGSFILNKNELVLVGAFDSAKAVAKCDIVRFPLVRYYSATYIFTGNGSWDLATNWQSNIIPPVNIMNDIQIIIDPVGNGECLLSRPQKNSYRFYNHH